MQTRGEQKNIQKRLNGAEIPGDFRRFREEQ